MVTNSAGRPFLRRASASYQCKANSCLCGSAIQRGDLHVSAPGSTPDWGGRERKHYSVRYHVVCFFDPHATDGRNSSVTHELDDLGNFDKYGGEAQRVLDEYKKSLATK